MSVLVFFGILLVLVLVHELGHFLAARRAGVAVEEFGFGFPPRLAGIRRGGTLYSINLLPLGGFVKLKGEDGQSTEVDSFAAKSVRRRLGIVVAGVVMNFLLAAVLLSIGFMVGLPSSIDGPIDSRAAIRQAGIQVVGIASESPAATAGLEVGDFIRKLDGQSVTAITDIQAYARSHDGQAVTIEVDRFEKPVSLSVTPRKLPESEAPAFGVSLTTSGIVSYPWYLSLWMGLKATVSITGQIVLAFGDFFRQLVVDRHVSGDLSGPVGIAVLTGRIARLGFSYILQFAALLSLNLAIINIIPFPALDGGRALFLLIEKIRGRPVSRRAENLTHSIGFALLIGLILVISVRDVSLISQPFQQFLQRLF